MLFFGARGMRLLEELRSLSAGVQSELILLILMHESAKVRVIAGGPHDVTERRLVDTRIIVHFAAESRKVQYAQCAW